MSPYSARCPFYKHVEMQIDVSFCSWLFLATSKSCARNVLLPVSGALNVCRIVKPSSCPAACFGYFQDAWWCCTAEGKTVFISLLWVHITDRWKASLWQFYGSMWRFSANQGELRVYLPVEMNGCDAKSLKCAHCSWILKILVEKPHTSLLQTNIL